MTNRFTIHFKYREQRQQVFIEQGEIHVNSNSFPVYQVYKSETYLFSLCPVIDDNCSTSWELIEKDRADYMPAGFISTLGNWIDQYYISKAHN
ncbi:MAG: hypothetical protein ACXWV4_01780 [Flavitalea sp.]